MKIIFSTDQIYLHGGIENVMALKANYFADVLHHDVYIVTTEQQQKNPCYPLSNKIKRIDIKVDYFRKKSYFHPLNLLKIPSHFLKWRKVIRTIKPEVIIVCNYAFDFYWTPFFFKSIPKLKEFHSSRFFEAQTRESSGLLGKLKFRFNDFIESNYTKLVLLNPDEKQFYTTNNLVIIPNPIPIKNTVQATLNSKKAIAAGRIAPVKGFENAILSWKKVVEQAPDWELHIYGQGEKDYIISLQKIIQDNNLTQQVVIKPAVSNLETVMSDYSLYIMTSHTECFPMVLLESLSLGIPVVSFDCPTGPRNIITNNEDGFLVENQNIEALAEKIVLLTQDENCRKQMGTRSKLHSERFLTPVVMKKWQQLFESVNQ